MQLILVIVASFNMHAQLRVPFTPRTSISSPNKKIYSIKGDFTIIGNTNLTLQNYSTTANNNNITMQYVDIDDDPNTLNSSASSLAFSSENQANSSCTNIIFAGLYWTGKAAPDLANDSPETFDVTKIVQGDSIKKTYNKRTISLKGPNSNKYTQFTAAVNDIYFPNKADTFIYSAYAEVTDYVRNNGIGKYFAADLALMEGNGGGTGYSGGWALVVVYENPKMKYRDITITDGHAYVLSSNENGFELPISGFNTIQKGDVGIKLGLISSEGDVGIPGDYFQIQKQSDTSFLNLNHSSNSVNNFFNSSINTGNNEREPFLENNTGIDISMFTIPNPDNTVIANNQTSTQFKYGTSGDTYAIFAIVLAVDAYSPEVDGIVTTTLANTVPSPKQPYSVLPDQEINFNVDIKNSGVEAIDNYKAVIPIPFNATYIPNSAFGEIFIKSSAVNANHVYFDASLGSTGALVWDLGTLALPENPDSVIGNLTFKLKPTTDCEILSKSNCNTKIIVNGYSSGTGSVTGVSFLNKEMIHGYSENGICGKLPINDPLTFSIDSVNYLASHCQNNTSTRSIMYCGDNDPIQVKEIASNFPAETLFYDSYPISINSKLFDINNPFTINPEKETIYFAVTKDCYYPFTIKKCNKIVANDDYGIAILSDKGGVSLENILLNDNLNTSLVSISLISINLVNKSTSNISLNGTQIIVSPGTPPGNYELTYEICEKNSPNNCDQAKVHIRVFSSDIIANEDNFNVSSCVSNGVIGNIFNNDTLNGQPVNSSQVTLSLISGDYQKITLDNQGNISLIDSYKNEKISFSYQICDKSYESNCKIANVTIDVKDTSPPEKPLLNDIKEICSTTVKAPATIDNCKGEITGVTNDPIYYNSPGNYLISWVFDDGNGNTTVAIQNVIILPVETIKYSSDDADCNNDIDISFDLNKYLPQLNISEKGHWTTENLEIKSNLEGSIFRPYNIPVGDYIFNYTIDNQENCPKPVELTMNIDDNCLVLPECNFLVHNAITPNDDGVNDILYIENIDQTYCFPTNSIEIFNRWGKLVFEANQYDNTNQVFRGISEGKNTVNKSSELPSGTYFYIINYSDEKGSLHQKQGYLYLTR